jgi:hypothetical protein
MVCGARREGTGLVFGGQCGSGRQAGKVLASYPSIEKLAGGQGMNEREKEDAGNTGWTDMRGGLRSLALRNVRYFVIETFFYAALVAGQLAAHFWFCPETGRMDLKYWNACLLAEYRREKNSCSL